MGLKRAALLYSRLFQDGPEHWAMRMIAAIAKGRLEFIEDSKCHGSAMMQPS
jgi:hypothetical protein